MSATRRAIILTLLVLGCAIAAGGYAYWHFLVRGPFSGATFHDFGEVPLYEDTARVEHTFHLVNRTSKPLPIVAVRSECGCVVADFPPRTVQPGESFDLPVTMIANHEHRTVPIRVLFADDTQAVLRVRSVGVYQPRLWSDRSEFAPDASGATSVAFTLGTYSTYDQPDQPRVSVSDARASVEFGGWSMGTQPKPQFIAIAPTIWHGVLRVDASDSLDDQPLSVTIEYQTARPLVVHIARDRGATTMPSSPTAPVRMQSP